MTSKVIPLYITHSGDGVTARYSSKERTITKCRDIHLVDFQKSWVNGYRSVVLAVRCEQDFTGSQSDPRFVVEDSLVEWCQESTKVAFSGVVRNSSAVQALMETHLPDLPETVLFIYQCEERIVFQLIHKNKTISLIHIAQIEISQGVEKLLARVTAWYDQNGITNITGSPQQIYFIGKRTGNMSLPTSIKPIFPEIETSYLIAAGIEFVPSDQRVVTQPLLNGRVRMVRYLLVALSIISLLGSAVGYGIIRSKTDSVFESIHTSELNLELPSSALSYQDSLHAVARHHLSLQEQLMNHYRWSDILDEFSIIPHDGVIVNRFGSRNDNGVLAIAFDGEGETERSVTGFVEAIKLSPKFDNVQLTQLSRGRNGKQGFRIQCIIQ